MPLVCAAALPRFPPDSAEQRLRRLCARWEALLKPRLSPAQLAHCRRFGERGAPLEARASRLLARLLALRALPEGALVDTDAPGRPSVCGAPGWNVAFSHSGRAAFCLILAPGETQEPSDAGAAPALDAEAVGALPPTDRCFSSPSTSPAVALRRWTLAEALFKALGCPAGQWAAVARAAERGAAFRAGFWQGPGLAWRFAPTPGHLVCVALPGALPSSTTSINVHWFTWQSLT
ncbi:MAG: 4'-phosphopantetheinyl transferase superfamily protein [Desulfovibrio sp.]|nr:4'-phosphopantetheinyl transferase superfamily protein [Desulfovibrio sp.]